MENTMYLDISVYSKRFRKENPYTYFMCGFLSANILYDEESICIMTGVTETSTIAIVKMLNGAYSNGVYKLSKTLEVSPIENVTTNDILSEAKKNITAKPYSYSMINASTANIFYDKHIICR
jgi:hypothetical protein